MLICYARVSTESQTLDPQIDQLTAAGCERIFSDTASGGRMDRKGLSDALGFARPGDTLVVVKLDRLGRTIKGLIDLVDTLDDRQVGFKSLGDQIDTGSATGRLFFHIIAAFAEMERELIRERTQAGLAAARARGRNGGRPKSMDEKQVRAARLMLQDPGTQVVEVAKTFGVSISTLYRYVGKVIPAEKAHH